MAALDFREIPSAAGGPDRDHFELFARETLAALGFRVIQDPDRGPDAGRDIIVEEDRIGPGGRNVVRWLVSCKHNAHSGKAVTPTDDPNVGDRLLAHSCNGFIAFYSTIPSSSHAVLLTNLAPKYEHLQLDNAAIERRLLAEPESRSVAARFMPKSFNGWIRASQRAANENPVPDPHRSFDIYFMREPHSVLDAAMAEAQARNLPVFAVVYDAGHPQQSNTGAPNVWYLEARIIGRQSVYGPTAVVQSFNPPFVFQNPC